MCDNPELGNDLMVPKEPIVKHKPLICIKCKANKPTVIIRSSKFCKECFLYNFEGKFRSIINKANVTNDKTKKNMLVGFSGGPSSRVLLQLLYNITNQHKKYGTITILYIDETSVTKDRKNYHDQIKDISITYGFEFVSIKLDSLFGSHGVTFGTDCDEEAKIGLEKFLGGFPSVTSKLDMIDNLKYSLLVQCANQLECSMLLLGDCGTRIAIKTIALTAKGRGFSLPFEVAAESKSINGLVILRPLRDSLAKEIGLYNYYHKLSHYTIPTLTATSSNSIDFITTAFMVELDHNFPATVSTVVRTANKLQPTLRATQALPCPACLSPAQKELQLWRDAVAVRQLPGSSEALSYVPEPKLEARLNQEMVERLCYSCLANLEGSKLDLSSLPSYTIDQAKQQKN